MLAVISTGEGIEPSYVVFRALDVPEEDGYRVLARLVVVDVAGAVRGEIGLAILVLGDLELAACGQSCRGGAGGQSIGRVPLIQAHGILHEEQRFFRQERWAQRRRQVELVQKHSGHAGERATAHRLQRFG